MSDTAHDLPIVVIGAGPKAAALAAKSHVLRKYGHSSPTVVVIEKNEIGANWSGNHGYTTGRQRLGTPPEKDIGFPYSLDKDHRVTKTLFRDFSWTSYLMFKKKEFSEWVNRGRPHPIHHEWKQYLTWALKRSGAVLRKGLVKRVVLKDSRWEVETAQGDSISCQGVVVTGPGPSKRLSNMPSDNMVMAGDDFWRNRDRLSYLYDEGYNSKPVLVIGGGETAASVVSYLVDNIAPTIPILVVTRSGTIFTRGEGYYENRMFSDLETWRELPERVRKDVINRGDRGVFSVDVVKKLATSHNVEHSFLRVEKADKIDECLFRINGNEDLECQMIIQALGFDPYWFVDLFDDEIRENLSGDLPPLVEHDLSLSLEQGYPKIYAPMISGLEQGPGFPNLSCLGTLSDRVLGRTPASA